MLHFPFTWTACRWQKAPVLYSLVWGSSHPPPCLSLWPVSSCFLSTALNFAPFPALRASSPGSHNGRGVNCLLKDWGLFCAAGGWSPMRVQLSAGVAPVVMRHSCEVQPVCACTLLDTKSLALSDDFEHLNKQDFFFKSIPPVFRGKTYFRIIFIFKSQDKGFLLFFLLASMYLRSLCNWIYWTASILMTTFKTHPLLATCDIVSLVFLTLIHFIYPVKMFL